MDLIKFFGCENSRMLYEIINQVPSQLFEMAIDVPFVTEEGYRRFGKVRIITSYATAADLEEGNAYIQFRFNDELKPHLLELKRQFTKYDLKNIIHIQSTYSIRMFEILKSYEYKKTIDLEVDYLKNLLEITVKYRLYGDFKRFILDKAQEDLLEHCDIAFNYKEIKRGRRIFIIRFTIFKNEKNYKQSNQISVVDTTTPISIVAEPQPSIQKNKKSIRQEEKKETEKAIIATKNFNSEALYTEFEPDVVKGFGVTPFVLVKLIENYDAELIRKQIRITKRKRGASPTTNIAGFFVEAVKTDYNDPEEAKEAKKQAKIKQLEQLAQAQKEAKRKKERQEEYEELSSMVTTSRNNTIRKLVANDSTLTPRAIEYATARIQSDATLLQTFQQSGYTFAALTLEDWRQEVFLRNQIIEAMQKIEPKSFLYLSSLVERMEEITEA